MQPEVFVDFIFQLFNLPHFAKPFFYWLLQSQTRLMVVLLAPIVIYKSRSVILAVIRIIIATIRSLDASRRRRTARKRRRY